VLSRRALCSKLPANSVTEPLCHDESGYIGIRTQAANDAAATKRRLAAGARVFDLAFTGPHSYVRERSERLTAVENG
jgi:hypothetical protein